MNFQKNVLFLLLLLFIVKLMLQCFADNFSKHKSMNPVSRLFPIRNAYMLSWVSVNDYLV